MVSRTAYALLGDVFVGKVFKKLKLSLFGYRGMFLAVILEGWRGWGVNVLFVQMFDIFVCDPIICE